MSFSENVLLAKTSCQILEVLSFCNRERAKHSPLKITAPIFQVENSTMKLSGLNIFRQFAKKPLSKISLLVVVLKSKLSSEFAQRPRVHMNMIRAKKNMRLEKMSRLV